MGQDPKLAAYDFKGLGFSKIGYFKEVRAKIKELEGLNLELARRHNKLATISFPPLTLKQFRRNPARFLRNWDLRSNGCRAT